MVDSKSDLYLRQLRLGPMQNFVYLIGSRSSAQCVVVDPAWDIQEIISTTERDGMKLTGALISHYHPDHCGGHLWGHDIEGVAELIGKCPMPVYVNTDEADGVQKITGISRSDIHICRGGDTIDVGNLKITTIHTPGHTPGSQCFLTDGKLVSGDTLFISGCGRVDLPGGSSEQLFDSLSTKLAKLPKNTILYPGHQYDTAGHATLEDVAKVNPYLQAQSLSEWRSLFGN